MYKYFRRFLREFIHNDSLTFDDRVFNLSCAAGIIAIFASVVGHVIEHSNTILMLVKVVMATSALLFFIYCNRYKRFGFGRIVVIIGFCDILFPLLFITGGGVTGGIPTYFVLTIALIVLLAKGSAFYVHLSIHLTIIILCFLLDMFYNDWILPLTHFQIYADSLFSIIVAAIFIGLIIVGIGNLFRHEKLKAEEANMAKSNFLAQMSHEIRTPLNAIMGVSAIMEKSDSTEQYREGLKKINTASSHLLGVINDILDMAKIESGKFELSSAPFRTEELTEGTTAMAQFSASTKQQDFRVSIDPDLPEWLDGDRQRIEQVLTNLLSNAIKFTQPGGAVHLEIKRVDTGSATGLVAESSDTDDGDSEGTGGGSSGLGLCTLRASVSDNGIGITEEQMSRLFRAFEQADNSTSRRFGGTGLGLAISKYIVEQMGGTIQAESTPGQGSVFSFEITLPVSEGLRKEADSGDLDMPDLTGHRILIAEDVDINREIICTLLAPTGAVIDCAENGALAVDAFFNHCTEDEAYDLILMDIQMPEMDGYEATRRIRAMGTPCSPVVPIVAMTANVFKEDVENAKAAGMDAHLGKPIVLNDVFDIMRRYLRKNRVCGV